MNGKKPRSGSNSDKQWHRYFLRDYLRVIIVAEPFGEGVVVYFQLRDLCEETIVSGKRDIVVRWWDETREATDAKLMMIVCIFHSLNWVAAVSMD